MIVRATTLALLLLALAAPADAQWFAVGGWNRSDLGLHEEHDGFQVGVGRLTVLENPAFDVAWSVEYVQRRAGQPMVFDDVNRGPVFGTAKVTLGQVQTLAALGWRAVRGGDVLVRPWAGASVAIAVHESWDKPDGSTNRVYSYENLDMLVHLGLTVGWRGLLLEVRGSQGLLEQLIDRDYDNAGGWEKANDDLDGIKTPEAGSRNRGFQVGLGLTF